MKARGPALFITAFLSALPAVAQVPSESAEALFVRARALMKTGDCPNALPLLEQSHAIEPTIGVEFNMAICEGRLGKLTQASKHLRSVIDASGPNDERRVHAERALRELLPRIPYLVVELDARNELELVRLDGEPLTTLRPNEPFAVNPGPHELEVALSGAAPQVRRFSLSERQVYTWSLGNMGDTQKTPHTPSPIAGVSNDSAAAAAAPEGMWTTQRKIAVVAAGTSVAAFGLATGLAISAKSIYDSSNDEGECNGDVCGPDGIALREQARARGRLATIAVTAGAAAAVAAVTLWVTGSPASTHRSPSVRVGIKANGLDRLARGGGIVLVEGSYGVSPSSTSSWFPRGGRRL